MAHRFLSPEWIEAGRRLLVASPEFRKALNGRSTQVLTIVTDGPREKARYLWLEFKNGQLAAAESSTDGDVAKRNAELTITGSYRTFAALQTGALSLQAAYFQRHLKLGGNIQEAMTFAPAFAKYQEIVRKVETEF